MQSKGYQLEIQRKQLQQSRQWIYEFSWLNVVAFRLTSTSGKILLQIYQSHIDMQTPLTQPLYRSKSMGISKPKLLERRAMFSTKETPKARFGVLKWSFNYFPYSASEYLKWCCYWIIAVQTSFCYPQTFLYGLQILLRIIIKYFWNTVYFVAKYNSTRIQIMCLYFQHF